MVTQEVIIESKQLEIQDKSFWILFSKRMDKTETIVCKTSDDKCPPPAQVNRWMDVLEKYLQRGKLLDTGSISLMR